MVLMGVLNMVPQERLTRDIHVARVCDPSAEPTPKMAILPFCRTQSSNQVLAQPQT
jgi:hypothetical protein